LAELTSDYLTNNGLSVSVEHNGAVAVDRIKAEQPDLVILDLMLPGEDGLSVCRLVRSAYSGPIIMLTARTDELDQVVGLEVGADDYICKPVAPRLLLARISAMLRRTKKSQAVSDTDASSVSEDSRHHFGRLVIDNSMREAWLGDDGIELTSAEFDLLWLLASNAGRVINREEIFTALRGIPYDGQDRSIDVRVSRIRPKIGDDPDHPRRIKTVRSRGYLFVKEH
ncbi:MAG: two-component system response regulator RstA, partial [Oceanospirillaceae bacterium]